jgi:hypothetical protein
MAMKKLDKRVGAAFAAAGIVFMILAIRNNPTDTAEKLEIMRHDIKGILANGGVVATESYNSKFGSAYLYTGIDAKSWSPTLADSYNNGFLLLGWKRRDFEGGVLLCKGGISAKVSRDIEYGEGKAVYGINMTYNALTIRRCDDR